MIVPLLCLLVSFQFLAVLAAVSVVESLDNQLPSIARVSQSFSWSFSPRTFSSTDGELTYTTSALPAWLSFDPPTRTFRGTPSHDDEGNPEITVTAQGPNSSASSILTLCVTHFSPPILAIPFSEQFVPSNPALSSVFLLSPGSAIATSNPALRVPRKWSFSIGLQSETFRSDNDIFYEARLSNGTELPEWMVFNSKDVTFDGVVPTASALDSPTVLSLQLIASDQEGYTASSLPFDLVIAEHELAASSSALPTINYTAVSPFSVSLLSPADFSGVLVDGDTIQPSNITTLIIDTSSYSWLKYDAPSRTLSGIPEYNAKESKSVLPVKLMTIFNQSIQATVSLQLVPSYFLLPELPSLHLSPGDHFEFGLDQFYSNSSAGQRGDTNISVSYDPIQTANWVRFDSSSGNFTGTIPDNFTADHVTVTFTAYSRVTHSTSHSNMIIFMSRSPGGRNGQIQHPGGLSVKAHKKLVLALAITFGVIGGLCLLGGFFACFRRLARVEDTALIGEEGRNAWSEKDRRWYGITLSPRAAKLFQKARDSTDPEDEYHSPGSQTAPNYGSLGLGLQRVAERSYSNPGSNVMSEIQSPGVMSKREFITRIKQTVRQVSDKYSRKPRVSPPKPVIGKPILIKPAAEINVPRGFPFHGSPSNPFDDVNSQRGSTFMTGSPSTSTADHSIPRRRADFAPPRSLAQVRFEDGHLIRQPSNASFGSDRLDVVSRNTSIISGRSTSRLSHDYPDLPEVPPARPRLVPFTSSTRVPVPRIASLIGEANSDPGLAKNRIASQRARIIKAGSDDGSLMEGGVKKSGSSDELSMGLHYVQSLGADETPADAVGIKSVGVSKAQAMKFVVKTGEKFHLRAPIPVTSRKLQAKQHSGQILPKFLHVNISGAKGMVEVDGIALARDLGIVNFGLYADKECIAKIIVEVIGRK